MSMPKFPKKPTPVKNKNSNEQQLPNRHAMATLTGGNPMQRTMNNYAKATPGPSNQSPTIFDLAGSGLGA